MLFEFMIASAFLGLSAFAVVRIMQPRDALVVYGSVETSLWDKLLSLWTMVNPTVEIPMIDLGTKPSYELITINSGQEPHNYFALVCVLICGLLYVFTYSIYSILQPVPLRQLTKRNIHMKIYPKRSFNTN